MRWRPWIPIAAAAAALLLGGCFGSGSRRTPPSATVTASGSIALPPSFFGLSVEWNELPDFERHLQAFERILRLWKVTGNGPQVLRLGGDSADLTYWNPPAIRLPAGAYMLKPAFFSEAAHLIAQTDLRVILDLNLRNSLAPIEAGLAREAERTLPTGSIIGFQIGNEPDRYNHGFTPKTYSVLLNEYAAALAKVAPHVTILGPAVTNAQSNIGWLEGVGAFSSHAVGELDAHRYMLGGKDPPSSRYYPTIARMLSDRMTRGLAQSVRPAIRLAKRFGKPFRLDELGSANSGGRAGVSNTFATALWAPDALFSLWAVGLQAVNMHIRAHRINGPLAIGPGGFTPRPLFYGMALFARAASPAGRLLPLQIHSAPAYHLSAWAVRVATGALHVVLIDKGSVPAAVRLTLEAHGPVQVQRMLAPSVAATSGVTLAGQTLAPDGALTGRLQTETIVPRHGIYTIPVPAGSAALVIAPHSSI